MPSSRRNSLGRNHNKLGRFTPTRRASRKSGSQTRKALSPNAATVGTKAQVFHGTAKHTAGGLTQSDLVKNKRGHIVSRKQQAAGKKAIIRLRNSGKMAEPFKAK